MYTLNPQWPVRDGSFLDPPSSEESRHTCLPEATLCLTSTFQCLDGKIREDGRFGVLSGIFLDELDICAVAMEQDASEHEEATCTTETFGQPLRKAHGIDPAGLPFSDFQSVEPRVG